MQTTATHIRQLEAELFQPATRKNKSRLNALLAEDFREFGSSGRIFTKRQIIQELHEESPRSITLIDFEARLLAPGTVHVTYRATRTQPGHPDVQTLRSSLWVEREGRWQMLFHQGTMANNGLVTASPEE